MKTIRKNKEVKRVTDSDAKKLVSEEGWEYCPKSEWKKLRPNKPTMEQEK